MGTAVLLAEATVRAARREQRTTGRYLAYWHCQTRAVTLTGRLDRPDSAVALWARQHLTETRALSAFIRQQAGRDPSVPAAARPYPRGWEPGRQATAHQLRLELSLAPLTLDRAVRMAGRLPREHARPVLDALALTSKFLAKVAPWNRSAPWLLDDDAERALACCCWLLAQLEAAWRRGMHDPAGPLFTQHADGRAVLAAATTDSVSDLVHLAAAAAAGPFADYRTIPPDRVVLGPVPSGERDVGGADGDLLIGGTLVEVKTVGSLDRLRRQDLWQIAIYVLLDYQDTLFIDEVALYLGRHAALVSWPVQEFFSILTGEAADLAELRQSLRLALESQGQ